MIDSLPSTVDGTMLGTAGDSDLGVNNAGTARLGDTPSSDAVEANAMSGEFRPDWETRSPPPLEHFILPALKKFQFKGVTNYLEDFVTIVDAPQLEEMNITFIN
jgi:hypothetical protein